MRTFEQYVNESYNTKSLNGKKVFFKDGKWWPVIELRDWDVREAEFKAEVKRIKREYGNAECFKDSNGVSIFEFVNFFYESPSNNGFDLGETISKFDESQEEDAAILDDEWENYISGPSTAEIEIIIYDNWDWGDEKELLTSTILHELVHAWIDHQYPMCANTDISNHDPHLYDEWIEKCADVKRDTGIDPNWETFEYNDGENLWSTLDPAKHPHPEPDWKKYEPHTKNVAGDKFISLKNYVLPQNESYSFRLGGSQKKGFNQFTPIDALEEGDKIYYYAAYQDKAYECLVKWVEEDKAFKKGVQFNVKVIEKDIENTLWVRNPEEGSAVCVNYRSNEKLGAIFATDEDLFLKTCERCGIRITDKDIIRNEKF